MNEVTSSNCAIGLLWPRAALSPAGMWCENHFLSLLATWVLYDYRPIERHLRVEAG